MESRKTVDELALYYSGGVAIVDAEWRTLDKRRSDIRGPEYWGTESQLQVVEQRLRNLAGYLESERVYHFGSLALDSQLRQRMARAEMED